jgi:hypothetical protein
MERGRVLDASSTRAMPRSRRGRPERARRLAVTHRPVQTLDHLKSVTKAYSTKLAAEGVQDVAHKAATAQAAYRLDWSSLTGPKASTPNTALEAMAIWAQ